MGVSARRAVSGVRGELVPGPGLLFSNSRLLAHLSQIPGDLQEVTGAKDKERHRKRRTGEQKAEMSSTLPAAKLEV